MMLTQIDMKSWLSHPWVAKLFGLSCALLVLMQLIHGINQFFLYSSSQGPVASIQMPSAKPSFSANLVLNTALFGEYVPQQLTDIKRSLLNLTVVGILFAHPTTDSQVIIRLPTGQEKMFHVGDTLPGGAIIRRITPDGILVMHNQALESLTLPKHELRFEPIAQPLATESQ